MEHRLTFDLHLLTARMDRSADRMLMAEYGLSYRRFLALLIVGELGAATQRELAERLGVSEAATSRMAGILAETDLLDSQPDPSGGNRRQLTLTPEGEHTVEKCQRLLERRFASLVQRSGVPYDEYAGYTQRLLAAFQETDRTH